LCRWNQVSTAVTDGVTDGETRRHFLFYEATDLFDCFHCQHLAASSANLLLHEPIPAASFLFVLFKVRVSVTSLRDGQTDRQPIKSVTVNCCCNTQARQWHQSVRNIHRSPASIRWHGNKFQFKSGTGPVPIKPLLYNARRAARIGQSRRPSENAIDQPFPFFIFFHPTECPWISDVATRFASAAHLLENVQSQSP
jgi:hypothetical protein